MKIKTLKIQKNDFYTSGEHPEAFYIRVGTQLSQWGYGILFSCLTTSPAKQVQLFRSLPLLALGQVVIELSGPFNIFYHDQNILQFHLSSPILAVIQMIIYNTDGLKKRIGNHRADEADAPFLHVLAHGN